MGDSLGEVPLLKSRKIAFVYNGQGSQHETMGHDFYQSYPTFKKIIDRFDLDGSSFFDGLDEASLKSTKIMQPMIYTFNYALTSLLLESGLKPIAVCGQSLGEYNALVTSAVLSFEDGLTLTKKRGEIMKKATLNPSMMMAAIGDTSELLKTPLPKDIYISNINSDSQVVLGGTIDAFEKLKEFKPSFIKRLIPLKTEAAFHTPLMNEASQSFETVLQNYELKKPTISLYQNIHGLKVKEVSKKSLIDHINHPVIFNKMIQSLKNDNVDTVIEIGPKSTLKKLIQSIDFSLDVISVYDTESFEKTIQDMKGNNDE